MTLDAAFGTHLREAWAALRELRGHVADVSDSADAPPLAPWQGGPPAPPFVSNIPSHAGSPGAEPMVDGYNVSSLN
jgi:hypothetical protein